MVSMQLLPVISGTVEEALLRWLRAAELTCDRAALLVAQVPLTIYRVDMSLTTLNTALAWPTDWLGYAGLHVKNRL